MCALAGEPSGGIRRGERGSSDVQKDGSIPFSRMVIPAGGKAADDTKSSPEKPRTSRIL